MRSKKPSPPEGARKTRRWRYHGVPCKTAHNGWLAGEPFGAYVHFIGRHSEPCARVMSDNTLECEFCARGMVPEWRGYTPWYDTEYAERFSIITEDYNESVCEIPHLSHVVLRRGISKTDPCVIRSEAWRTTPIPHAAKRAEPVDLARFCVHVLWGNQALRVWDLNQPQPAPATASKPKTPGHMYVAAHRLIDKADPTVPLADLFGGMVNRVAGMAPPVANGKAAKPKG